MLLVFKLTCGIKVVDLCDVNEQRLNKQGKMFRNAGRYTDYVEMIDKTKAGAVYLAVPHYLHYPMMKKALSCGKHILCEKPITIKNENAYEIVDMADKAGLEIAVNYQYRYDGKCFRLVNAVQNNDLGKINFMRCIIPWKRERKYFDNALWHASKEKSGGGTLITQGSHLLDIILWMNNCGIKVADGVCRQLKFKDVEVEDFCFAELELENGVPVQFLSTMAAPVEGAVRLEVFGDKGYGEYIKKLGSKVRFKGVRPPKYKYGKPALHAVQKGARDFRDSIISGKNHLCTGRDSIKVLEAVNFIYENTEGVRK
jgi:predicted dehydrogenase